MHPYRVLAQAEAFHRRRLVAAFTSGQTEDAGSRSPALGRCLVSGLLLSAICAGAIASAHHICGHPDLTWEDGSVAVSW
jgi:hypothetical protein